MQGIGSSTVRYVDHTYRDFSRYIEDGGELIKHKKCEGNFPAKIHKMLSDPRHADAITWMPHGRAWKVLDKDRLMKDVLPEYIVCRKYESFTRQLNGWGFKRLYQSGPDHGCYYHEAFLSGLPKLTCLVRRLLPNLGKATPFPAGEPNFYRISGQYPLPDSIPASNADEHVEGASNASETKSPESSPKQHSNQESLQGLAEAAASALPSNERPNESPNQASTLGAASLQRSRTASNQISTPDAASLQRSRTWPTSHPQPENKHPPGQDPPGHSPLTPTTVHYRAPQYSQPPGSEYTRGSAGPATVVHHMPAPNPPPPPPAQGHYYSQGPHSSPYSRPYAQPYYDYSNQHSPENYGQYSPQQGPTRCQYPQPQPHPPPPPQWNQQPGPYYHTYPPSPNRPPYDHCEPQYHDSYVHQHGEQYNYHNENAYNSEQAPPQPPLSPLDNQQKHEHEKGQEESKPPSRQETESPDLEPIPYSPRISNGVKTENNSMTDASPSTTSQSFKDTL